MGKEVLEPWTINDTNYILLSQVSERIEETIDRLRVGLSTWADVLSSKEEIEGWSNSSVPQLAESISNLNDSLRAAELLKEFEVS